MTTPSGGHFHFSQDVDTALTQIAEAIKQFPPRVQGSLRALQDELVLGVAYDPSGVDELLTGIFRATQEAEAIVNREAPKIAEALSRGVAPTDIRLQGFQQSLTAQYEEIGRAAGKALQTGLLSADQGRALKGVLAASIATTQESTTRIAGTSVDVTGGKRIQNAYDKLATQIEQQTVQNSRSDLRNAQTALVEAERNAVRVQNELNLAIEKRTAEERQAAGKPLRPQDQVALTAGAGIDTSGTTRDRLLAEAREANKANQSIVESALRDFTAALELAKTRIDTAAGVVFERRGAVSTFVDTLTNKPISDSENSARLRIEELRARTPIALGEKVSPEQLLAESNADSGNKAFRADRGTVPLGNGNFARFDENFSEPGGRKEPTIFRTTKGSPEVIDPDTQAILEPLKPAQAIPVDRDLEPVAYADATKKAIEIREKVIASDLAVEQANGRVLKAQQLLADADIGLVTSLNKNKTFIDADNNVFALKNNKRGQTEAVQLNDEDAARVRQAEADKAKSFADRRNEQQRAVEQADFLLRKDPGATELGRTGIIRDSTGATFQRGTEKAILPDDTRGQNVVTARPTDPSRDVEIARRFAEQEAEELKKSTEVQRRITEQKDRINNLLLLQGREIDQINASLVRDRQTGTLLALKSVPKLDAEGKNIPGQFVDTARAIDPNSIEGAKASVAVSKFLGQDAKVQQAILEQKEAILENTRLEDRLQREVVEELRKGSTDRKKITRDVVGTIRTTTSEPLLDDQAKPIPGTSVKVSRVATGGEEEQLNDAFAEQTRVAREGATALRQKQERIGAVQAKYIEEQLKTVELQDKLNRGLAEQLKFGLVRDLTNGQVFNNKGQEVTPLQAVQAGRDPAKGFGQSFLGGLFSQGFNSEGDEKPAIDAIGGTAGNLLKYAVIGKAIQDTFKATAALKEQTLGYDTALTDLNIALEATGGKQVNLADATAAGAAVNLDATTSVQVASQAITGYSEAIRGGASASDVAAESIKAAGEAALLTGQQAAEAQKQLQTIIIGQGLKPEDQGRVLDAAVNAKKNFGGNLPDIQVALGVSAEASSQAGLSVEKQANIASLIQRGTGQSGSAVGGDINRLVAREANPQFLKALGQANVDSRTGDLQQQIVQLSVYYNNLGRSAQQAFERNVAGGKSLGAILPLLREGKDLGDAYAKSVAGGGAASEEAAKRANTYAERLKNFGNELKSLAADIGSSGIFLPFGVLLEVLEPVIKQLDELAKAFNSIPSEARLAIVAVTEAAAAFFTLKAVGGFGNIAKAAGLNNLLKGGKGGAVAAGEGELAGATVASSTVGVTAIQREADARKNELLIIQGSITAIRERQALLENEAIVVAELERELAVKTDILATDQELIAAEGELGALQLAAAEAEIASIGAQIAAKKQLIEANGTLIAEEEEQSLLSKLGGFAGILQKVFAVAIAAAIIDAFAQSSLQQIKLGNKAENLRDSAKTGNLDETQKSVSGLRDNATELDKSASGIVGGITNFVTGLISPGKNASSQASDDRKQADALGRIAAELAKDQVAASQGSNRGDLAGLFNLNIAGGVDAGFKVLQDSGRSASTQLRAVSDSLEAIGKNAPNAITALGPLAIQTGVLTDQGKLVTNLNQGADIFGDESNTPQRDRAAGFEGPKTSGSVRHRIVEDNAFRRNLGDDADTLRNFASDKTVQNNIEKDTQDFLSNTQQLKENGYLDAKGKLNKAGRDALLDDLKQRAKAFRDALKTDAGRKEFDSELQQFVNGLSDSVGAGKPLTPAQDAAAKALAFAQGAAGLISKAGATGTEAANLSSLGEKNTDPKLQADVDAARKINPNASDKTVADRVALAELERGVTKGQQLLAAAKKDEKDKLSGALEQITAARDAALIQVAADTTSDAQALLAYKNSRVASEDTLTQGQNTFNSLVTQRDAQTNPALKQQFQTQINQQNQTDQQGKIDLAAAQANVKIDPANKVGLANQAVKDAQAQVDLFAITRGDTTSKAYLDAVFKLNQLTEQAALAVVTQANAVALSKIDPRDAVGLANQTVKDDVALFNATPAADVAGRAALTQKIAADKIAAARATTERDNARRDSTVFGSDTVGKASAALQDASALLKTDEKGTAQYYRDLRSVNDAKLALARANADLSNAQEEATLSPGSAVQAAQAKLDAAIRAFGIEKKGTVEYFKALAALHAAQNDLAQANIDALKVTNELKIDTTDPVAEANLAVQSAKNQLAKDRARKAAPDVINKDLLDLEKASESAQKAQLDQQLSLHATQYQLRQISLAQYLTFLRDQDTSLRAQLAATKKGSEGYQQLVDELNGVDQTIQGLNATASGLFNIGNIKAPTVFQIRTALGVDSKKDPTVFAPVTSALTSVAQPAVQAATAVGTVSSALTALSKAANTAVSSGALASPSTGTTAAGGTVNNYVNHVSINGVDFAKVVSYINSILGPKANRTSTTPKRVR